MVDTHLSLKPLPPAFFARLLSSDTNQVTLFISPLSLSDGPNSLSPVVTQTHSSLSATLSLLLDGIRISHYSVRYTENM